MNNEDIIIRLEHVSKSFGDKKVLDDINLYVKKGEFITFLGPSGCGKTTLLRLIAGFLAADSGVITMDGKDLNGVPPHKRELNTVFQRYALFPHLDVYDNIAFGLKLKRVPEDEIDRKVSKVLKRIRGQGRQLIVRRPAAAYSHCQGNSQSTQGPSPR